MITSTINKNMDTDKIRQAVNKVISLYLGEETAKLYNNFYKNKESDIIITSARELLSEVIGDNKADEEINNITKN